MTLEQATKALTAATAPLAKLDAEIKRAKADENEAREAVATLIIARDSGARTDFVKLASELAATTEAHDAAIAIVSNLESMRPPLVKRVDAAQVALDAARRESAKPDAARLEADTRAAFAEAFGALERSRAYREANGIPCTGGYLTFANAQTGGGGLADLAASHGFSITIRKI